MAAIRQHLRSQWYLQVFWTRHFQWLLRMNCFSVGLSLWISHIPWWATALDESAELYTRAPRGSGSVKAMGSGTGFFSVSPSGLSKTPKSSSPVSLSASQVSWWLISQSSEPVQVMLWNPPKHLTSVDVCVRLLYRQRCCPGGLSDLTLDL